LQAQHAAGAPLYNQVLILERRGPLNQEVLERSFSEIIRRHATLRTTFPTVDGTPTQLIADYWGTVVQLTELGSLSDQDRNAEVLRIATEEARSPFDLAEGPLVRVRLIRLSKENYILIVTVHYIVADDWSLNILARELGELYQAYSTGEPSRLCDLPIEYIDYAYWQRDWLRGEVLEQHISYWRERLAGMPPVLDLPTDRPRALVQVFRGARQSLALPISLNEMLQELSVREKVTPALILLAAFQTLLLRYTGQDDIAVGWILPGRDLVETEGLVGLFAETMIIRTDMAGNPTFRGLLGRMRDAASSDCDHHSVPLDRLVRELQPESDPSRNPLTRVLFSVTPSISLAQLGWEFANLEVDNGTTKADLQLQLYERPTGIFARFTYNTDLFDAATISRLAEHFEMLLRDSVANPDQHLSRLAVLTETERHQLLVEWNSTQADYPKDYCVHQLFESQVGRTPDAIALAFEHQYLTYDALNTRANQLAHHLQKLGVGPGVLVGICVERSLDMVVGLLGILKAGGAYVPFDPAYPPERVSFMLEDAKVSVLLTQNPLVEKLPESGAKIVCLDTDWHEIAKENAENSSSDTKPEDLVYVIYTSGSTGKPKGVQIPHRAVVNFLTSMSRTPGMTAADRLLAVTTLSFDIAGLEIYLPLSTGASLEIVRRDVSSDGNLLLSKLKSSGATVLQATPATWRMLLEAGWEGSKNLKVLCGGEGMPTELAGELLKRASSVWNMYGPTETTIWSTTARITSSGGPISVGRPIANTKIYVLDSHLEPVPVGVPGELYIGGDSVARGYLRRPSLTAQRFIPNPFREQPSGGRLYRTGDLVRYLSNGELECLGRIDHQVKVRGFRIELGEIENLLGEYPGVLQNVVVAQEDNTTEKQLVAYVVPVPGQPPSTAELRNFLKQRLPNYMLPSRFIFLEALPLTPNGKVDRRALPVPEQIELAAEKEYAAPRDNVETQLVKLWESVLGIRPVGIKYNFFDLGGHSLRVAKLIRRIEQAFGKKLSMAAVFQAPTIEQQAVMLRNNTAMPRSSVVVPIQPAGSRPPLFFFGFNAGPLFLPLARRLGPEQPLLCVDPTTLNASQLPAPYKMEDIAVCLLKEIRKVQPEGPYCLGGMCVGGLVAYETARQLVLLGEKVALLALIEPQAPIDSRGTSNGYRSDWLKRRLRFHLANLQGIEFKEARLYILGRARTFFHYLREFGRDTFYDVQSRMNENRPPNVLDAARLAAMSYSGRPFNGPVTLFQAANRTSEDERHRQRWEELAATLDVHEIPGYSSWVERFFLEPHVDILAQKLSGCFGKYGSQRLKNRTMTDHTGSKQ